MDIIAVVSVKIFARLRSQAFFILTKSAFFLDITRRNSEIRGRTSDVAYIALKRGFLRKLSASLITFSSLLTVTALP